MLLLLITCCERWLPLSFCFQIKDFSSVRPKELKWALHLLHFILIYFHLSTSLYMKLFCLPLWNMSSKRARALSLLLHWISTAQKSTGSRNLWWINGQRINGFKMIRKVAKLLSRKGCQFLLPLTVPEYPGKCLALWSIYHFFLIVHFILFYHFFMFLNIHFFLLFLKM